METAEKISKLGTLAQHLLKSYRGVAVEPVHISGLDFPTTREENWKYTRTSLISARKWEFSDDNSIPELPLNLRDFKNRIVFVNGNYSDEHSTVNDHKGIEIKTGLAAQHHTDSQPTHAFEALSRAYPQEGIHITVQSELSEHLELQVFHIFTGQGIISQPVNTLFAGRGTRLSLSEFYIHTTGSATFANVSSKIELENGAQVHTDMVQIGSENSAHFHQTEAILHSNAVLTHNMMTLSGKWTRNNTNARISGKGAECNFNGFYIPSGNEFVDNHTIIDHEEAHSQSNELYRGVLLDQSVGVFNGKVYVRQDAQKTNAFQSNGNVLLSDTATMNSKPELEIYADDVKCSHGSTTGQLDEEAIFYLQARGLSAQSARKMLVAAFAESVLEKINNSAVRELTQHSIEQKLRK
jgi:Fe-S cluster assembly protein SufD